MLIHKTNLKALFFLAWLGIFIIAGCLEHGKISCAAAGISCVILYVIIAVTGMKSGLLTFRKNNKYGGISDVPREKIVRKSG